jgi:hypothetical protein
MLTAFEKEKEMSGSGFTEFFVTVAALFVGIQMGMSARRPDLPEGFNHAARVGQVTPKQAAAACRAYEDQMNALMKFDRAPNKEFAPRQHVSFNCGAAILSVQPAAPAAP